MSPPPDPPLIRPATDADLDGVLDVLWTVAGEGRWLGTEVPFDRGARRARLGQMVTDANAALVVAVAPEVVGFIDVRVARYGVADIGMAITGAWRGKGLGRNLLSAAVEWATAAGAHKMSLEVWPDNVAARNLYRAFGFVEEGRKIRHYRRANGELWDAVVMGRPLLPE